MTISGPNLLLNHIKRLGYGEDLGDCGDADLLKRFLGEKDESAFTHIVQRHGAMVWGVCRSLLQSDQDAEDVFQATFLVLNRSGDSIQKQDALAGWLYKVACRLSQKRRHQMKRQAVAQCDQLDQVVACNSDEITWREMRQVLHEEISQLSEKHRLPIVLCHLEELTQDEAAQRLGWTFGELRGRLLRGRQLLRNRLARRGIDLSAALLAVVHVQSSFANTIPSKVISTNAQPLADNFLPFAMTVKSRVMMSLICCCFLGVTIGAWAYLFSSEPQAKNSPSSSKQEQPPVHKDTLGDPLPPDVLFRLGTIRLRHGGSASSLFFSPEGDTLFSGGGQDRKIRCWNVANGKEMKSISGLKEGIVKVVVSADNTILAAGGIDGNVHVYERSSGKKLQVIPIPETKAVDDLAISGDGSLLVTGGRDKIVRLWNTRTGKQLKLLHKHEKSISEVSISPDGKLIASSSYDKITRVMEVATGKGRFQSKTAQGAHRLCFSPDSETLVTGTKDAVELWDVNTGQRTRQIEVKGSVSVISTSRDGKTIAAGVGQQIYIWDMKTGKEIHQIKAHPDTIQSLVFSPDDKTLASGGNECAIRLWSMKTGESLHHFPGHSERITAVAASQNGQVIATAAWDRTIRIWSTKNGKQLRKLNFPENQARGFGSPAFIRSLVFSPNGKSIAAASGYEMVIVWDVTTGKELWNRRGSGVDFSSDGKRVALSSLNKKAYLLEMESGKEIKTFNGHTSPLSGVKFSPDGKTLATISYGAPIGMRIKGEKFDQEAVWLWDVASGEVKTRLGIPRAPAAIAFTPDGVTLASTGFLENAVTLWETTTGKKRGSWSGPQSSLYDLAISSDGKVLAAASMDKTIQLWHLPTGVKIRRLEGHRSWATSVAFLPGGQRVLSGSLDTTGLLWDISKDLRNFRLSSDKLSSDDLQKLWNDLPLSDAEKAYQAIGILVASSDQSVPFLAKQLKTVQPVDPKTVDKLIAQLDAKLFTIRARASRELAQLGERAEGQLRHALKNSSSLESRRRVEELLKKLQSGSLTPEQLQVQRAVEVLEYIANSKAQAILKRLSEGEPNVKLTKQATASLRRLSNRSTR